MRSTRAVDGSTTGGRQKGSPAVDIQIAEGITSLLIIEDEGLVSMMIEDMAREMGVTNVRICMDLESALHAASTMSLDCAVLDVRVRGGDTAGIADILAERQVPFLFSTGGGTEGVPVRHRHRPMISKPFDEDDFKTLLLDTCMGEKVAPCEGARFAIGLLSN